MKELVPKMKLQNNQYRTDTIPCVYYFLQEISKFLKENKIKTFNGLDMFIYQGQKSFYLWNKINPEIDNQLIDLLISKLK